MNQSDFRVSGTNEFEFGFSSSSAATSSQSGYGRARPKLRRAKLRRKGDDAGLDGRGKSSSVFGLPNEFRKLNVRESDGAVGFSSVFEFRSRKSHDGGGGVCVGMLPEELRKLNLEGRGSDGKDESGGFDCGNGLNEAMLAEKMESVRIEERVGVSSTGADGELLCNENLKNGIKENVFFRVFGASQIPSMGSTGLPNVGPASSSLNAPTASSSATPFSFRDEAKFSLGTGKFAGPTASGFNSSLNRKPKIVPKRHTGKDPNLKKKNENVKLDIDSQEHPAYVKPQFGSKEFSSTPESPQSYSPMDMSPYPEVTVNTRLSNETSVSSEELLTQGSKFQSSENNTNDENCPVDDDLVCATQQLNIGEVCIDVCGTNMDNSEACASEHISEIHADSASGSEIESFKSAPNDLDSNIDSSTSTATKTCSTSNSGGDRTTHFYSVCDNESINGTKFTFTASTSSREPASLRRYRKIYRRKEHDSYRSTATSKVSNAFSGCLQFEDSLQNKEKPDSTRSHSKAEMDCYTNASKEVINETSGTPAATTVAQETCEKWRLRGNQAYANGDSSKAEEYYTRGVESIPIYEKSRVCLKALTLCYSNRAASRMAMGRLREAIEDCKLAAGIDPGFLKAYLRAANCFLALGEIEEASKYFKYCLQPGMGVCTDRKVLIEASEGLQNTQKAAEFMNLSIASIQQGTCSDAENALRLVGKVLTICLYSEKLLEIKAEALFLLQKYGKVIHLCEDSYGFAERNCNSCVTDHNLWRCRLMLKSYFFLGKLEDALAVLAKNESLRKGSATLESLIPLVSTVKMLLQYKGAGNEAFQSGKYWEAIEHYTAALSFNVDSHPFAAICFCNRAAAYKALGKTVDAIADCNLAVTLERDYLKAISRRASLYESIRDYGQAASDMERIVSLLKEQANGSQQTTLYDKSTKSSIPIDLRQAQMQLAKLEKQGSKGIPLNFYLILGVESVASAAEIKKAYRNAALKHHPDKAGQILSKGNSGRNGTWNEIAEEIHRNADRLFKLIGEAYTVLSDPSQRSTYDAEEEYRDLLKNNREPYASRTHVDARNYPFEASMSRRQWNDYRRSYGR